MKNEVLKIKYTNQNDRNKHIEDLQGVIALYISVKNDKTRYQLIHKFRLMLTIRSKQRYLNKVMSKKHFEVEML